VIATQNDPSVPLKMSFDATDLAGNKVTCSTDAVSPAPAPVGAPAATSTTNPASSAPTTTPGGTAPSGAAAGTPAGPGGSVNGQASNDAPGAAISRPALARTGLESRGQLTWGVFLLLSGLGLMWRGRRSRA
jgi:hypothetical protein